MPWGVSKTDQAPVSIACGGFFLHFATALT